MEQEYWKWPESSWTSKEIDWKSAKAVTAGVDVGTTGTQAAIMCDEKLFGYANIHTGGSFKKSAKIAVEKAMGASGMALTDIRGIMGTGAGGRNVEFAGGFMDGVRCQGRGARFLYGPEVHTVVDLGGQSCTAIRLYDWDRVWDFMMNDKCATGIGRNIEFMCDMLQVPIQEIGPMSLEVETDPEPVATSCYCFADTETMGLFGRPEYRSAPLTENEVYAKYLFAVAWRCLSTIGKLQPMDVGDIRIHYPELGFTGGLAKNPGITKRIERELKITALTSEYDPQLAGAIGAALLAPAETDRRQRQ
ncbi:MAG: acyl-CoA dehydratase activase [Peptococcaceae bacterium]|jgi:benzoyl-CoA reductase subunit A|nr:acyl-CoA dehydratase activase [Peptococcaceae bacterium]